MARLLQNGKTIVDLAAPAVRVSRIRRDPVSSAKEPSAADIREQDARGAIVGMIAFALAMFVILVGSWTPPTRHPANTSDPRHPAHVDAEAAQSAR